MRGGRVVGRGAHTAYGGPHAEVVAIHDAGPAAAGATAYVSLEPCTTHGKTPPCATALADAGVVRVVYAATDPNPVHHGRARAALRARGVAVRGPVEVEGARTVLAPFRRALRARRPWVLLKWASSLDGRVSPARGRGGVISGAASMRFLHELRAHVDAIAVGAGTVAVDDPRLTSRLPEGLPAGRRQPDAVLVDSALRVPERARVLRTPGRRVFVLTSRPPAAKARRLAAVEGVEVVVVPGRDGRVDLARGLAVLRDRGVRRLLVEGGPRVAASLLAAGLVDQVAVVLAPLLLGGGDAPTALAGAPFTDLATAPRLRSPRTRRLGEDTVVEGYLAPARPRRVSARSGGRS